MSPGRGRWVVPGEAETAGAPGRPSGGESLVHSPKSIPSDTLPRATESRMAPRPFSQAWRGEARIRDASPQSCLLWPFSTLDSQHLPALPPNNTHLLVLLQGDTGLSPILSLDKEQLVPLDVFKDALGRDTREVRVQVGRKIKGQGRPG